MSTKGHSTRASAADSKTADLGSSPSGPAQSLEMRPEDFDPMGNRHLDHPINPTSKIDISLILTAAAVIGGVATLLAVVILKLLTMIS